MIRITSISEDVNSNELSCSFSFVTANNESHALEVFKKSLSNPTTRGKINDGDINHYDVFEVADGYINSITLKIDD